MKSKKGLRKVLSNNIINEVKLLSTAEQVELFDILKAASDYRNETDKKLKEIKELMPDFKFGESFKSFRTETILEIRAYQDNRIAVINPYRFPFFGSALLAMIDLNNADECYNNSNTVEFLDVALKAIKTGMLK